jgi:hypothetical protein
MMPATTPKSTAMPINPDMAPNEVADLFMVEEIDVNLVAKT